MDRLIINKLEIWKAHPRRKPLLIRGARQVGKTWLMKEFAATSFKYAAYLNFESSKSLSAIFEGDFDIKRILTGIKVETGILVQPHETLLIFDEIQACPLALTYLKYFAEKAPEYPIIAAGSLLGVALHRGTSFPVGKVDFLDLYPMNFEEFLLATGRKELYALVKGQEWELIRVFKERFAEALRQYFFVGGMPEAVGEFAEGYDFAAVRTVQRRILDAYEQDFSKHAPASEVPRIRLMWQSIPAQLSRENRKFMYGLLKEGARAKEFEMALAWLIDAGLLHKVSRVSKPGLPLAAYADHQAFKLFMVDTGLLSAMGFLDAKSLLQGNAIFEEFKGALAEQYVLQQLKCIEELPVYYWSAERATAEVDFLVQHHGEIIPIEVKAEENLKAKSLRTYYDKFNPANCVRTSMADYRREPWLTNVPLYAIGSYLSGDTIHPGA